MTVPQADQGVPLFSDADLDAMIVEIDSGRSVPEARDIATQIREFHGWTLNKLDVFENYLKMYRRVAGGGTYIDAFAGTGKGRLVENGQSVVRDGSSVIASKSGAFSALHLIEKNKDNFELLDSEVKTLNPRQSSRIHTYYDDCNSKIRELLESGELDVQKPCFALLDQESTQLDWDTIERLAHWKTYESPPTNSGRPKKCKVELWILFNSHQAMSRLWPHNRDMFPESFSPQTLDRVFGSREAWWGLWEQGRTFKILIERFTEQLRNLGYQYVLPQLIKDPMTGRPQYHMIHATDHPSAVSFMRWAKRSTDGFENQQLPGI